VPDLAGIRRLSLADLDQPTLEDLVRHGEDLLVERKRDLPKPPGFGAAAASFANTLGGWILLGIDDKTGAVHGWEKPERLDLQSHLGSVLRAQVDPLPPFVCDMREVDGEPIAVIRVFPSVDSPHIVRGTGAVYVRSSKGKEPVDDHRTLLELARRGEDADRRARERLPALPVVARLLKAPDNQMVDDTQTEIRFIARAAPLTVTPALTEWPLTRKAGDWCVRFTESLLPPVGLPGGFVFPREGPYLEPFGRAIAARLTQERGAGGKDGVLIVADSGGVVGVELRRGAESGDRPTILLEPILDEEIRPLVMTLAALLYEAEAYGRAIVDLWIVFPPEGFAHGQSRAISRHLHVSGELTIPADESEAAALAVAWHREIQREAGIVKFEREPIE
jgi:Putative DNA-binding domain